MSAGLVLLKQLILTVNFLRILHHRVQSKRQHRSQELRESGIGSQGRDDGNELRLVPYREQGLAIPQLDWDDTTDNYRTGPSYHGRPKIGRTLSSCIADHSPNFPF